MSQLEIKKEQSNSKSDGNFEVGKEEVKINFSGSNVQKDSIDDANDIRIEQKLPEVIKCPQGRVSPTDPNQVEDNVKKEDIMVGNKAVHAEYIPNEVDEHNEGS